MAERTLPCVFDSPKVARALELHTLGFGSNTTALLQAMDARAAYIATCTRFGANSPAAENDLIAMQQAMNVLQTFFGVR